MTIKLPKPTSRAHDEGRATSLDIERRALEAMRKLRERISELEARESEPVAIVGMACRFPGADGLEAFRRMLERGADGLSTVPEERWDIDAYYDADPAAPGRMYTRRGGFLKNVTDFDNAFFGIAPNEAATMDPQQRLTLEVAWEALEDAGIPVERLAGTTAGVFLGIIGNDHLMLRAAAAQEVDANAVTGTSHSVAAGRISYLWDLRGPALAVDTACSSSLMAIHLALQSLRGGETSLALAGGVNLILSPESTVAACRLGALSPDGVCRTFDAEANGFARGEGCAMLVLKRLRDARADGDRIWAVLRGSASNQDGRSAGLTAPNPDAQARLIEAALRDANMSAAEVGLVETHGTGTPLGDPIEVAALAQVLGAPAPRGAGGERVFIGSVKGNIGHLEAAAGVAGVIKAALSIRHGTIFPQPHFRALNPAIELASRFAIATERAPWQVPEAQRAAGVSSFGISGTNVHLVLSGDSEVDAPRALEQPEPLAGPELLLTLSAQSRAALRGALHAYAALLERATPALATQLCAAAARHRSRLRHLVAIAGSSPEELASAVRAAAVDRRDPRVQLGTKVARLQRKVVFVYPGQGPRWLSSAAELLRASAPFREAIVACDRALRALVSWSLLELIEAGERELPASIAQPALLAIQIGLTEFWAACGVRPDAVLGHSLGEVAAAYVAGALSLESALKVAVARGRVIEESRGNGRMAIVHLTAARTRELAELNRCVLEIAAFNAPESTVVSGDEAQVTAFVDILAGQDIFAQLLDTVDFASHCSKMNGVAEQLERELADLEAGQRQRPMMSTSRARWLGAEPLDGRYWSENLRSPVRFTEAVTALQREAFDVFVEINPQGALGHDLTSILGREENVCVVPSWRRTDSPRLALRQCAAALYAAGLELDARALHPVCTPEGRAALPRYAWQGQCFELPCRAGASTRGRTGHPILHDRVELPMDDREVWSSRLNAAQLGCFQDHRVHDQAIVPATAMLDIALHVARTALGDGRPLCLRETTFEAVWPADRACDLRVVSVKSGAGIDLALYTRAQSAPWQLHARTRAECAPDAAGSSWSESTTPLQANLITPEQLYAALRDLGLNYGPAYRGIAALGRASERVWARVSLPESAPAGQRFSLDPARCDAALHVLAALQLEPGGTLDHLHLPVSVREVVYHAPLPRSVVVWARRVAASSEGAEADLELRSESGQLLLQVSGFRLQRLAGKPKLAGSAQPLPGVWLYDVQWKTLPGLRANQQPDGGVWLILNDETGVGSALADQLAARGVRCQPIEPAALSGAEALRRLVLQVGPELRGVVHLQSLDAKVDADDVDAGLSDATRRGTGSLIELLQVLAFSGLAELPRVVAVTSGASSCNARGTDEVPVRFEQAGVIGLARSLPFELPDLDFKIVDLDPTGFDPILLADEVLSESPSGVVETLVALRGARRLVPRLLPHAWSSCAAAGSGLALRAQRSYLITGGLSGLGLAAAQWLAARGAQSIYLVGRSAPSEAARAVLDELTAAGCQVHVRELDAARRVDVRMLVDEINASSAPLAGVLHSAVVLRDGPLVDMSHEDLSAVIRPKLHAAYFLHEATLARPLDFFVVFSSAVAMLGSPGQANYAAASTHVDALMQMRARAGLSALTINWGPWAEIGRALAAKDKADQEGRTNARLVKMIEPSEGFAALELLLQSGARELGVLPYNLTHLLQHYPRASSMGYFSELLSDTERAAFGQGSAPRVYARPDLDVAYVAPRTELESTIASAWQRVLGIDAVGLHDTFFALGGDSVLAGQLLSRLGRQFELTRIDREALFKDFTVENLARLIEHELMAKLEGMSDADAQRLLETPLV